jgi:hypothetical protein
MNYIVEDNFDFYGELNALEPSPVSSNTICMISHEPLTYNSITLQCKHAFNYVPLYTELCMNNNAQFITCPYCRTKSDKLIPFIPLPTIKKVYGVNHPAKMCMPIPKCSFILRNGMYKGQNCDQNGIEYQHGVFCHKHLEYNNVWTAEKEQLFKMKSVLELKEMLKEKGLKVGGIKKDLVNRLFEK